ncbi:MAG: hypothetical protein ACR2JH_09150 [Solirubrobacteraceae bacterium]
MRERPPIGLGAGLAGGILVIVIAWALAAVLMLTGTLTNTSQINDRVKQVNAQVDPIDKNLAFVKLAARTGRISAKIRRAAQPLSGELTQVVSAAGQINSNVSSILTTAGSINGVVNAINGNARAINGTVRSINANATAINGNVNSINSNVQSISGSVGSISGSVASINGRVTTIRDVVGPAGASDGSINALVPRISTNLGAISSTARSIRAGVSGINDRADVVIALVRALKSDFASILAGVGTTINSATILGHANSIDCSKLINFLGPTQSCGK